MGHNPQAAEVLFTNVIRSKKPGEKTLAVFGMLADKDMTTVSQILADAFDEWFVASLTGPRAATAAQLSDCMKTAGIDPARITTFETVAEALAAARARAKALTAASSANNGDRAESAQSGTVRIIVFGSFVTVTAALGIFADEGIKR